MCSECCGPSPATGSTIAMDRRQFLKIGGAGLAGAMLLGTAGASRAFARTGSLASDFEKAAKKYEVPESLLLAMGYVNSLWEMPPVRLGDYNPGDIHGMGGYGIMHLRQDPEMKTLGKASRMTNTSGKELKANRAKNIMGGAAVLASLQGSNKSANVNDWYDAVREYGGDTLYANQVYETLKNGASATLPGGERVALAPQPQAETQTTYTTMSSGDYPGSTWYGASSSNYSTRSRGAAQIDTIVVHVTQGSWSSAISWFGDSRAQVSAHYVMRRSDGFIGQCVREKDIAWHAGNWNYNSRSIGIEHEGYYDNPNTWTDAMIRSSARLAAYLCKKYGVPTNRVRIIGHGEVPNSPHPYCPGSYFPWGKYMNLVRYYVGGSTTSSVYQQVVDNASPRFSASGNWQVSAWNSQRYGKNYRYIKPRAVVDDAKFKVRIPKTGNYTVYGRWPANSGYNNRTRFYVKTWSGWVKRIVNQRWNGGKWVKLGTFKMGAGDRVRVVVAGRSSGSGYIIADAVLVRAA